MRIWLSTKTQDEEFNDLRTAGHTGSLNDMQFAYLAAAGYSGALADKMAAAAGGDTTAPVLSGNSFNDTLDSATFTTTEGGTFVWATHPTTETLTANGSGGWTGTLLESGTDTVATSGETTISAAYTAATGTGGENVKFSYYVRDAAGNDSNVITESFTVNSAYTYDYVLDFGAGSNALYYPYTANTIINATQADDKTAGGGYWFAAYFYYDGVTAPTAVMSMAASGSGTGYGVLYLDRMAWRPTGSSEAASTTIGALGGAGWYFITGHLVTGPTLNGASKRSIYRFWRNGSEATAFENATDTSTGITSVDRFGLGYIADSTPANYSDTQAFSFAWGHGVPDLMHSWVYNSGTFRNIADYNFGADANGATLQGFWTAARSGSATFDVADAALDDTVSTLDTPTQVGTMAWANVTTPW